MLAKVGNAFLLVLNVTMFLPEQLFRLVWWCLALLLNLVHMVCYVALLPLITLHYLFTHPIYFNILRWLILLSGSILFLSFGADPSIGWMSAFTIAMIYATIIVACFFVKGRFRAITAYRHSFPVYRSIFSIPSLRVPYPRFAYFAVPQRPIVESLVPSPPPPEEAQQQEDFAQPVPTMPPVTVAQTRENLPPHLRNLMGE